MGVVAWVFPLKPVPRAKHLPMQEVHVHVERLLRVEWSNLLPDSKWNAAWGWFSRGLVTLGRPADLGPAPREPELFIGFRDTVQWSQRLAQHWIALALGRPHYRHICDLRSVMRGCGYAFVKPPKFPAVDASFFVSGNKIGALYEDRIIWQLPKYEQVESASQSRLVMRRAQAALEDGCSCNYCQVLGRAAS